MKHKIVINNCYGRFQLSIAAIKRYYQIKNPELKLYYYKRTYNEGHYIFVKLEKDFKFYLNYIVLNKDLGDFAFYSSNNELPYNQDNIVCYSDDKRDRLDPILIQVVEELGQSASADGSELIIQEFEGEKYRIMDHDGNEWIETPDTIEWESV